MNKSTHVDTVLGRLSTTLNVGPAEAVPLVLSHGIFMDSTLWDGVLPALGDRTVVMVDGPGHGASDDPPDGWSLDDHVAALGQVMDHHDLGRAVLVGHSWGGMVSLRLTLAHPDRVAGLGLVNTPLARTQGVSRVGFRAQQALLHATGATRFYAGQAASSLYGKDALLQGYADEMANRMRSRRGAVLAGALSAVILRPVDMVKSLGRVGVPTSVIVGTSDYVLPAARRAVTAVGSGASLTVVEGGHVSPQQAPAATAQAVRELLGRVDRA